MTPITISFLPLTDCATLAVAHEKGFAEEQGIGLDLIRDVSWATIRDRLIYGQAQAAHLLSPLAVAVSLGLTQHRARIAAPFKLSVNGNAIAFSRAFADAIGGHSIERVLDPAATARRIKEAIPRLPRRPVLGIVHRFSCHALALRYWLAYAGIDPDSDVDLRVIPPPLLAGALAGGEIDGFTAGEPWNSTAVDNGDAEIVATGSRIWESGPEKVLAMREDWAEANPDVVDRLLVALDRAAAWSDQAANHPELAQILARPNYIGRPAELILRALTGRLIVEPNGVEMDEGNFLLLHRHAANFPWRSQALWIYSQLVRWEYLDHSDEAQASASRVFRSDIYRRALAVGTTPLPGASSKVEGSLPIEFPVASQRGRLTLAPDRFFDGRVFDPTDIGEYLAGFQP